MPDRDHAPAPLRSQPARSPALRQLPPAHQDGCSGRGVPCPATHEVRRAGQVPAAGDPAERLFQLGWQPGTSRATRGSRRTRTTLLPVAARASRTAIASASPPVLA